MEKWLPHEVALMIKLNNVKNWELTPDILFSNELLEKYRMDRLNIFVLCSCQNNECFLEITITFDEK